MDIKVIHGGYLESTHYTAKRFYKSEGANLSGWIVAHKTKRDDYSDPIPNRREALQALRAMERDLESATDTVQDAN